MAGEAERRFNSIMDKLFTAPKFKSTLTRLQPGTSNSLEKYRHFLFFPFLLLFLSNQSWVDIFPQIFEY